MYALRSLTHQEQYSQLQKVVSSLAAAVLCVGALYPVRALGQGQPKPPVFNDPATFCTRDNCANSNPMELVIAELVDLEGAGDDGYPDVAVVNRAGSPPSVTVFHNTGDWSDPDDALVRTCVFDLNNSDYPHDIKAAHMGDYQGNLPPDGHLDLVITATVQAPADNVTVLFNDQNGQGQFGNRQDIPLQTSGPRGLVVEDLDLDGRQDVAVATLYIVGDHAYASVELLWREPDATWYQEFIGEDEGMPWPANGQEIVAGRVAKKTASPAFLDLVMSAASGGWLITIVNEGGRQFADPIVQWIGNTTVQPVGIALGRFHTNVIQPDLVVSDSWDSEDPVGLSADVFFWGMDVWEWDYIKDYELKSGDQVGKGPWGVAVGKINADTKNDFVVAIGQDAPCSPGGGIAVFVGYGDGTFREPPYLFCVDPGNSPKPRFVKIADMDQDGFNDVVTSNYDAHNISVLINALQAIPPGGG